MMIGATPPKFTNSGITTPSAMPAAQPASIALPPASRIRNPASAARYWVAEAMWRVPMMVGRWAFILSSGERKLHSLLGAKHCARPCPRISIVGNRKCVLGLGEYNAGVEVIFPAATKQWQSPSVQQRNDNMHKAAIRPGGWMAYEDHWFGEPWTVPETVVMVHGNSESSRAWTCWVQQVARHYRVIRPDLPGFGQSPEPPDYGWSAEELAADIGRFLDALGIETCHLIG